MNESSTQPVIETLRQFEAFDGLSEDDLTVIATRASVRKLPPRTILFRHGDDDSWIYCLEEGRPGADRERRAGASN